MIRGPLMPRPFDILHPLTSGSGTVIGPPGPAGPPGPPLNIPIAIQIFSGDLSTPETSPVRFGTNRLSLVPFPATNSVGQTRQISFVVNIETTNPSAVGSARLQNIDDDEIVTGSTLTTISLLAQERRVVLTVGAAAGNLKDDKMYEVVVFRTGGSASDSITVTNARLEIFYV